MSTADPAQRPPIIVVDDEPDVLAALCATLEAAGFRRVLACHDSRLLMDLLAEQNPDALLLDLNMPHLPGGRLLPGIREEQPDLPVIIVSAVSEIETAIGCMRLGVFDYLVKPIEKNKLVATVRRAVEIRDLRRENSSLRRHLVNDRLRNPECFREIVHRSEKMTAVLLYAESIAATPHTVLITGETGVGKELVARAIHRASGRGGELVSANVAGFDETMFSDSLFGHLRGAFTGAERARPGLIETAAGGTLFLDEIGDLGPGSQVKLLRLLEGGEYFPLGSDAMRRCEARIVCATNRDLSEEVGKGGFRKDLFYRLNTHHVHIPALRERPADVSCLLEHFVEQAAREAGLEPPPLSQELHLLFRSHPLPGNVRELRAAVYDALSRHRCGPLTPRLFGTLFRSARRPPIRTRDDALFEGAERLPTIREATEVLVAEALKRTKGNQSLAARLLGISPQALNQRLKRA